jgi:hypothetical protein
VLLLKRQRAPGGKEYDFSLWLQRGGTHLWFSLYNVDLPPEASLRVSSGDRLKATLPIVRRARPAPQVQSAMAESKNDGQPIDAFALFGSQQPLALQLGSDVYPLPADGLSSAMANLKECQARL